MTPPSPDHAISIWLLATADAEAGFATTVDALATEHRVSSFRPHITLHASRAPAQADIEALLQAAARTVRGPIELIAGATRQSADFYKTLFVEFEDPEPRRPLHTLARSLRESLGQGGYRLLPHLSLLYCTLSEDERKGLAARFDWRGRRFVFDRIAAVRPGSGEAEFGAVSDWDCWLVAPLGP